MPVCAVGGSLSAEMPAVGPGPHGSAQHELSPSGAGCCQCSGLDLPWVVGVFSGQSDIKNVINRIGIIT